LDAARLRRDADFAAVMSEGTPLQHRYFALRSRPNGLDAIRLAVSAPRSLGRAVGRNRARRRLREAFRLAIRDLPDGEGRDLVVTARAPIRTAPFAELRTAVSSALAALRARTRA
jgi:ribonuclease P protein component